MPQGREARYQWLDSIGQIARYLISMGKIPRKILIVAQLLKDRERYQHYLISDPAYSYTFFSATPDQSAIALWQQQQPDALLIDCSLTEDSPEEDPSRHPPQLDSQLPPNPPNIGHNLDHLDHTDPLGVLKQIAVPTPNACPAVVVLTNAATAVEALNSGAQNILLRGQLTPETLQLAINQAIENSQARSQIKHLQQQLHASNLFANHLLESNPNCVKLIDGEGRLTYMNAKGMAAMEIDRFEAYKHTEWITFWEDEYRPVVQEAIAKAKAGESSTFRAHCRTAKGTSKWWDVTVTPVVTAANEIEQFICVSQDVSDRIRSELTLKEAQIQLESALSAGKICTWRYDLPSNKIAADPQLAVFFGIEPEAAAHPLSPRRFLAAIHPDDRHRVISNIRQAITTGNDYIDEYRVRDADSQERYVMAQGRVEYDTQGNAIVFPGALIDLSDRKKTEEALKASERHSQHILDSLFSFVGVITLEGILLEANRTALEAADLSAEDVLGKPFDSCYWWAHSAETQARLRAAIRQAVTGEMVRYDANIRIKGGRIIPIDFTLMPVFDEMNQVEYLIPSGIDITERKQAEQALQESERRLRLALSNAQAGFWSWTISTGEIVWSDETFSLYGLENTHNGLVSYEDWNNTLHPDDREWVTAEVNRIVEQRSLEFRAEFRIVHPQQGIRWALALGSLTLNEQGEPLELSGINLDVTERKQAEIQQTENKNVIAQQLMEIEAIYHHAPIGLTLLDKELRFVRVNQHLADINGVSIEAHIGRTIREVFPKLADSLEPPMHEVLETGEPKMNFELKGETPAQPGVERIWLESWYPLKNANGEVTGINVVAQEITHRKQAEQDREQLLAREQAAREAAERANRIKDEFLAIVSHELRTPLNPILGWSQLLAKRTFSPQKTEQALETIMRNARMQAQLIDDLLDVSRILRGKLSLQSEPVSLKEVAEAAIETVGLSAEAKGIEINTAIDSTLGPVLGDASRLQQIVWNLLSNAVKFTPHGGQINLSIQRHQDQAQLTIRDTGKGIPAHFLPYIFDRFRQQDSATTRQFGGLGLGLSICRHLIELHGGTIWAESPGEGQGATFTMQLPLIPSSRQQKPVQNALARSLTLNNVKILVVDDDDDAREIASFLLEDAGAIVTASTSAHTALATLAQASFDVLISDIGMPDTDGYELMRQVRALPSEQGGHIQAISLTAYASEIDYRRAHAAGFQKHLTKPIERDVLIEAIASLLPQPPAYESNA
jgi:PAS domain S-box-containing protein